MKMNYNQFLAVVYSDIFDWPLTRSETQIWKIQDTRYEIQVEKQEVMDRDGFYFLPGREKLVEQRWNKEKISAGKKIIAEMVTKFMAKIPTIEAVFLTGSVAVGSARKDGDIDLMIITAPNTLWLTRAIVVILLKAFRAYGNEPDRICPNIFFDVNHLEIEERNLYTAHEILQAVCLYDKRGIERKWLAKNAWTKKYLPKAYFLKIKNCRKKNSLRIRTCFAESCSPFLLRKSRAFENWKLKILGLAEVPAFVTQYIFQLPKQTNERLGWGYALFHPGQLSLKVENNFRQRLVKYTE